MNLFRTSIVITALTLSSLTAYAVESKTQIQMDNSTLIAANMNSNNGMMMNMSSQAYSDRAFLSGMIPHHKAAVKMSQDVLKNGKDAQVKKWAQQTIADQNKEIDIMEAWLVKLGGIDKQAAAMMETSMGEMMQGGMNNDPDYTFVSMMIPHHIGALEMSAGALANSDNKELAKLAQQIVIAQTNEIMTYRAWLEKRTK